MINANTPGNMQNQANGKAGTGTAFKNRMLAPEFQRTPSEFLKILKQAFPDAKEENYRLSSVSRINKAMERLEKSVKKGKVDDKAVKTIVEGIESLYAMYMLTDMAVNKYILSKVEPEIKEIVKTAEGKHEALIKAADIVLANNKCPKLSDISYVSDIGIIMLADDAQTEAYDEVELQMKNGKAPESEIRRALDIVRALENILELRYEVR
ncbi:MAG: hypothetical protein WC506_03780 [Candidatus Micrarchaeia archaeon]